MAVAGISKVLLKTIGKQALKRGVKKSTLDNSFFGSHYKPLKETKIISKNPLGEKIKKGKVRLDKDGNVHAQGYNSVYDIPDELYPAFLGPKPTPKKGNFFVNAARYDNLDRRNKNKIEKLFKTIDKAGGKGTYSKPKLSAHIGRILGKAEGLPEDEVVKNIIQQVDPVFLGKMLNQRVVANPEITRAIKAGIIKEGDRPQLSHVIPVSEDYTKAMSSDNMFYSPATLNKRASAKRQDRIENYIEELERKIKEGFKYHDPLIDRYSLARGGKVDGYAAGGIGNISRRLFLKGLGALAGKAALPKTVTNLLPDVKKAVKMDSAPWINSMVNTVKKAADTGQSFSLGNGAKISYLKAPQNQYQPHQLSIKTVDGFEDRINFKEGKNDIDIEFDIRDDFSNNQHIYVDKKAGTTELVDDNYYMTSPEDFAKDDPIIWDVNKKDIRKNMMLADETPDDYMYDYMSVPDDSDYSFMWERYVDSFSPYGNIFKTKQLADKEKAKKLLQEEMDEMRFEEQFRGGDMHGFNRGGIMKDVVPPLDEYAAGGVGRLILKQAPKVINKLREFAPQITGKPGKPADLKAIKSGDTYYTVFDEDGLAIKDFPNEKVARDFIRNNEYADMYTMGKSTDDTLTAATQSDAPAMFFRSREEIIQGPPIMKGEEWLNFLQKRGIREGELSDTSLGPWLNANKGNKISKNDLVEKFDGMVPDFDVDVTGEAFRLSQNINSVLKKIDTSVYDPESAGVIRFLQTRMTDIVDEKSGAKALDDLDNVFEKAYGIKNVSQEGIPADNINVPYEVKQLMAEAMSGAGKRGVNLQGSAFVDRPAHAGSQTLNGGQNHREFIFRYNPKGPRKNEPVYNYSHSFGRANKQNAFMHARISDRVDEYGNKLLFVEEFQSDMHQPISAAVREATKTGKAIPKEGKYAPRLDKEVAKLNKDNLEQMANIQRQIDRLLETKPDSPKLAKLYEQKEIIRNIEKDKAGKLGENTSNIPEGPFKNSQDYMEFAIKYLLRVAKDGNYDGVAFSTPAIKNRSIGPDNRDYKGNLIAYGDILKNAIRKAKSKSGADLFETTIGSGRSYSEAPDYYGVPALMIKGNTKALEKISKGLPAYNEGGLVQNVFNDVVPTL